MNILSTVIEGIRWRLNSIANRLSLRKKASRDINKYTSSGANYDAENYWKDRHATHAHSFRGVGNISLTEEENILQYTSAAHVFLGLLKEIGFKPEGSAALDIGCGNGFWTAILNELNIGSYTGIDITDALFSILRNRYPGYRFLSGKANDLVPNDKFDLITMIDVSQHITNDDELLGILKFVEKSLSNNGVFLVTTWNESREQENFYEKYRLFSFYSNAMQSLVHTDLVPFRDKYIAAFYHESRVIGAEQFNLVSDERINNICSEILA